MVQLPLALAKPQRPQVERFVDSIVAVETEGRVAEPDEDAPEVASARAEIREAAASGTLDAIPEALERVKAKHERAGTATPNLDAALQKAGRLECVLHFSDAAAREMLVRYAFDLSGNPREIKRFVNLFRFCAYTDFWRKTQQLETPGRGGATPCSESGSHRPMSDASSSGDVLRGCSRTARPRLRHLQRSIQRRRRVAIEWEEPHAYANVEPQRRTLEGEWTRLVSSAGVASRGTAEQTK
jgi:hypothetical protein